MSYAPEDRHERDVGGSSRNPGLDMEKHEKTKGLKLDVIFVFFFCVFLCHNSCIILLIPPAICTRFRNNEQCSHIFTWRVNRLAYFIVSSGDKHLYAMCNGLWFITLLLSVDKNLMSKKFDYANVISIHLHFSKETFRSYIASLGIVTCTSVDNFSLKETVLKAIIVQLYKVET